jgi:hypothetical protein
MQKLRAAGQDVSRQILLGVMQIRKRKGKQNLQDLQRRIYHPEIIIKEQCQRQLLLKTVL